MNLEQRMRKKALKHDFSKYHIVAVGFSKKGDVIGMAMNSPAKSPKTFNTHAESRLIARYGRKIKKIVIARFGNSGIARPIDPCPQCSALAESLGIKIEVLQNAE